MTAVTLTITTAAQTAYLIVGITTLTVVPTALVWYCMLHHITDVLVLHAALCYSSVMVLHIARGTVSQLPWCCVLHKFHNLELSSMMERNECAAQLIIECSGLYIT